MKKEENNFAFIDSQNVNLGVRSCGWQLDWQRFRVYLTEKYGVRKAYLFIGFVEKNARLYQFLQEVGYILIFKPTLRGKNGKLKGNVDAELVLHTMIQYGNYDKAVIVSGDGDFACLVEHLFTHKKLKQLLVPNQKYSCLLNPVAPGKIVRLDVMERKLQYKRKEPQQDRP